MNKKKQTTVKQVEETTSAEVSPFGVCGFDASLPLENEGHERFCLEILNRKPNVRAYQLAYPDADYSSACASSTRLLRDDKIQKRLAYLKEEQRNRLRMSADDVIMGLEMATRFDPADLMNADGSLIPINQLPPEVRLCIEKIEIDEIMIGEGKDRKNIGRTAKVQVISKKSAYELLGRHHKLFTDKVIHEHKFTLEDILGGPDPDAEEAPQ